MSGVIVPKRFSIGWAPRLSPKSPPGSSAVAPRVPVALMNNQRRASILRRPSGGTSRRFGVPFLNPCVDRSASTCVPDNNFRGAGPAARQGRWRESAQRIVAERERHGPYGGGADPGAPDGPELPGHSVPVGARPVGVSDPVTIQGHGRRQASEAQRSLSRGRRSSPGTRPRSGDLVVLHLERALGLEQERRAAGTGRHGTLTGNLGAQVQPDVLVARAVSLRENR